MNCSTNGCHKNTVEEADDLYCEECLEQARTQCNAVMCIAEIDKDESLCDTHKEVYQGSEFDSAQGVVDSIFS